MYGAQQNKAHQTYVNNTFKTQSQGNLIVMLYDGAIRFLTQAQDAIEEKNYSLANEKIIRAQKIIQELRITLNLEVGDIAQELHDLYVFMYRELVSANLQKDKKKIEDTKEMLGTLRSAFYQINLEK